MSVQRIVTVVVVTSLWDQKSREKHASVGRNVPWKLRASGGWGREVTHVLAENVTKGGETERRGVHREKWGPGSKGQA